MTLLMVDDDMATVEIALEAINWKALGIDTTFPAYNISMAKAIMREHRVDIVICDIEMPMGSGLDLIKWAREQDNGGEFIFLTCHESFDFATLAIQYRALGYILKPFVPEQVIKEVIKAIEKL